MLLEILCFLIVDVYICVVNVFNNIMIQDVSIAEYHLEMLDLFGMYEKIYEFIKKEKKKLFMHLINLRLIINF